MNKQELKEEMINCFKRAARSKATPCKSGNRERNFEALIDQFEKAVAEPYESKINMKNVIIEWHEAFLKRIGIEIPDSRFGTEFEKACKEDPRK